MEIVDPLKRSSESPHPVVVYARVTGRKRTLFHCKWANLISYISIEITPDFLCPFMND